MPHKDNIEAPITLLAAPRSGTTLVASLFRHHPDFADTFIGETGNLLFGTWHAVEFSQGVIRSLRDGQQRLASYEQAARVVQQTFLTCFPETTPYWFHKPIGVPKVLSQKFDDTQWDAAAKWYWEVWRYAFPQAKFFTLLRHPCDVILSAKTYMGFDVHSLWWSYSFLMYLLGHPDSPVTYAIHYETLVQNKNDVVRALFDYLEIPFRRQVMDAFATIHVPSKGREQIQPYQASRQDEWGAVDPAQMHPIYRTYLNATFAKFGYPLTWPKQFTNEAIQTNKEESAEVVIQRLHKRLETTLMAHASQVQKFNEERAIWQRLLKEKGTPPSAQIPQKRIDSAQQITYIQELEQQLQAVYSTRVWRGAHWYWTKRNQWLVRLRALYRQLLPLKWRLQLRYWRYPEERPSPITPIRTYNKEKTIALVLPSGLTLGGVTTWAIEVSRQLASQQCVTLIRHQENGAIIPMTLPTTVPTLQVNVPALPLQNQIERYAPYYQPVLPATIFPNYNHSGYGICASLAKEQAAWLRVIGMGHTDEIHYYSLLVYYEPIIHRFVAVSQEIAQTLARLLPYRQQDIEVLPYGVKVPDKLDRTYTKLRKPLQLLYAGRLVEKQKRVMKLLELAQLLVATGVPFHLQIVGDGTAHNKLYTAWCALPPTVQQHITFLGSVAPDEMAALWHTVDICILVSAYEGTSISMLEAMAQGCVPVVTQVSGTTAVIEQGVNGYVTAVDDLADMVATLQMLAKQKHRLPHLGQQAYQTIQTHYSFTQYMARFTQLCTDVWQQAPRPWPAKRPPLPNQLTLERQIRDQLEVQP